MKILESQKQSLSDLMDKKSQLYCCQTRRKFSGLCAICNTMRE
jgi:hypothetical protein